MRWVADPATPGPDYCNGCQAARKETTQCGGCPRPNVLPPNEPVLFMLKTMASQWKFTPDGQKTGMDYTALQAVMNFYEIDDRSLMFERLQICEQELLKIQREQNGKPN